MADRSLINSAMGGWQPGSAGVQIQASMGGGQPDGPPGISLNALGLSLSYFTIGTPATINILNATNGSTITAGFLPVGFTLSGRTIIYDGTGIVGAPTIQLIESLAGVTRVTNLGITLVALAEGLPPLLGPTGFNLGNTQISYFGIGFPFLDRFKTSQLVTSEYGVPEVPVNADQYPTAMPIDGTTLKWLINVEGAYGPAGVAQNYVIETNHPGLTLDFTHATKMADSSNGGLRRITVDASNPTFSLGYRIELNLRAMSTPFVAGTHFIRMFRADEETQLKNGGIFTTQFLNRCRLVQVLRFMDWSCTNDEQIRAWADRPKPSWASWGTNRGVPYEVQIALCNEVNRHGHFHMPAQIGVTSVVSYDGNGKPTEVTHDDAIANEFVDNLAALLKSQMKPELVRGVEFSNEAWNFGFVQYFYLRSFQPSPKPGAPDYELAWIQQGIRMTRYLGRLMKQMNYDPNTLPIWGTQMGGADTVTVGNKTGVDKTLADWADSQSPYYDPDLAQRYREAGQLFRGGLAMAPYFSGRIAYPEINATDKATVLGWARDTTNAGIAAACRQLEYGDVLIAGDDGSFSGLSRVAAGHIARAVEYQIPIIVYETNIEVPAKNLVNYFGFDGTEAQEVTDFAIRLFRSTEMRGLFARGLRLLRQQGVAYTDILADLGTEGDAYATLTSAYGPLSPRGLGLQDFLANPGPGQPLAITLQTSGNYNVGENPKTRIVLTGGTGLVKLEISGIAPGRSWDGFRTISGTLTTAGLATLSIKATDQVGTSVTATFPQDVKPAVVGHRYVFFVVDGTASTNPLTSNSDANASTVELNLKDKYDRYINRGQWTITGASRVGNFGETYPVTNLIDGNVNSAWETVKGQSGVARIDCGASVDPGAIEITAGNVAFAPTNFSLLVSDDGVLANATLVFKSTPGAVTYTNKVYQAPIDANSVPVTPPAPTATFSTTKKAPAIVLSNNNLTATRPSTNSDHNAIKGSVAQTTGILKFNLHYDDSINIAFGIADDQQTVTIPTEFFWGGDEHALAVYPTGGPSGGAYVAYNDAAKGYTGDAYPGLPSFAIGDTLNVWMDCDAKKLWLGKNGAWLNGSPTANPQTGGVTLNLPIYNPIAIFQRNQPTPMSATIAFPA